MKTALILAGQLREFRNCAPNIIKALIEPTNADVYMYFSSDNKKDTTDVITTFKPIKYYVEEQDINIDIPPWCVQKERYQNKNSVVSIFQMWRKFQAAFKLIDKQYDWITKFRFDCKLSIRLDKNFFYHKSPSAYHIPKGGDWNGINDMMCVSGQQNMEYYFSLYDQLIPYSQVPNLYFGYEELVKFHLRRKTIFRFPCDLYLRKDFDGKGVEDRKFNL